MDIYNAFYHKPKKINGVKVVGYIGSILFLSAIFVLLYILAAAEYNVR